MQFVRKMGYQTKKKLVMFRPRGDMEVMKEFPGASVPRICPATVCDKLHAGYMIKYWLQVDDGAVSPAGIYFILTINFKFVCSLHLCL